MGRTSQKTILSSCSHQEKPTSAALVRVVDVVVMENAAVSVGIVVVAIVVEVEKPYR